MSCFLAIALLILASPLTAAAALDPPRPLEDGSRLIGDVKTVDRDYSEVEVLGFSIAGGISLRAGRDIVSVPANELINVSFDRQGRAKEGPQAAGGIRWTLVGGDCVIGPAISAEHSAVVIQDTHMGLMSVPLEAIAGLDVQPARAPASPSTEAWFARVPATGDDLVLLTNGDVLRGLLDEVTGDGLVLEGSAGSSTIPYRLVVSVRLANPAPTAPKSLVARVALTGGNRITLSELRIADGSASGRTPFAATVTFSASAISSIEIAGGRWEWLSEREPARETHIPMLDSLPLISDARALPPRSPSHRPTVADRAGGDPSGLSAERGESLRRAERYSSGLSAERGESLRRADTAIAPGLTWNAQTNAGVLGGPILVTGQRFERGLGVHSHSSLTYALDGAYREFVTSFGLDDSAGPLGDVDVIILVDGQAKYTRPHVRRGELHGPIRIDVAGAKRLELIADYGKNGDIQDRFNWVEPGLIRRAD